jgi:two-component system, response regulator
MTDGPVSILLIEDNDDHAELIMRCFENHGLANTIRHIRDGEQALHYLFNEVGKEDPTENPMPGLILLDLRIPKIDGLEVLKRIKGSESFKQIPVVVLTSSENDKDIRAAYENYANSYMVKPVDFHKFVDLMKDLGFYWLAWNRGPNGN